MMSCNTLSVLLQPSAAAPAESPALSLVMKSLIVLFTALLAGFVGAVSLPPGALLGESPFGTCGALLCGDCAVLLSSLLRKKPGAAKPVMSNAATKTTPTPSPTQSPVFF